MNANVKIEKMVGEALLVLEALGVPMADLSARRKQKMAKVFLAVAGLQPGQAWSKAKDNDDAYQLTTRKIIDFVNTYWDESISSGSYDDIRRKDLVFPVEAFVVMNSAKNPNANTNDGTRGFAIHPLAAKAIRVFGTPAWKGAVKSFHKDQPSLASQLSRTRSLAKIPVQLGCGQSLSFSPGKHNKLQKDIIESFLPIFAPGSQILYVGDTASKYLYLDEENLRAIKFFELAHDKLPDVLAYEAGKNWLFLVEAVTTANPITELRRLTLTRLAQACTADLIFITAFPDRATYRKFARDIAWETEVWIADAPEHMIHFNGHKFLGPYKQGR
jgi:hypothetical protein